MVVENPNDKIENESTWNICDAHDNNWTVRCDQDTATWLDAQLNKLGRLIQAAKQGGLLGGAAKGGKKAKAARQNGLKGGARKVPE